MSALFPTPLSAPAERVEADTDHSTQCFSRTLDQRAPHVRSSTAEIVPMGTDEPMHPGDIFVIKASALCIVVLVAIFLAEWFA